MGRLGTADELSQMVEMSLEGRTKDVGAQGIEVSPITMSERVEIVDRPLVYPCQTVQSPPDPLPFERAHPQQRTRHQELPSVQLIILRWHRDPHRRSLA